MPTAEKTLNIRLPKSTHARLAQLTETTGRTKSWLAVEALEAYLDIQSWQISEVKSGITEANRGEFATKKEMSTIFQKYGN